MNAIVEFSRKTDNGSFITKLVTKQVADTCLGKIERKKSYFIFLSQQLKSKTVDLVLEQFDTELRSFIGDDNEEITITMLKPKFG